MKNFVLILTMLIMTTLSVYASNPDVILGKIEDSLYGFQYAGESYEDRLSRVENTVYGYSNSDSVNARINKLEKDLSADLLGQEISPVEDTFENDEIADSNILYRYRKALF